MSVNRNIDGITVILSTYNRAAILRQTLRCFAQLQRSIDYQVDWVVVDNASSDETPEVIDEARENLSIIHLREDRPGKNHALNHALESVTLRAIVVFTDDDVTPDEHWLESIYSSAAAYSEYMVFGGRILLAWPNGTAPPWAGSRFILEVGFAYHDLGEGPSDYPGFHMPFGANFWVRREVFDAGFRFDPRVGPRPKNRIMGSESVFLQCLRDAGYKMLYVPTAVVLHRIEEWQAKKANVLRRAFRLGRSQVLIRGVQRPCLRSRSEIAWRTFLGWKFILAGYYFLRSRFIANEVNQMRKAMNSMYIFGYTRESWSTQRPEKKR